MAVLEGFPNDGIAYGEKEFLGVLGENGACELGQNEGQNKESFHFFSFLNGLRNVRSPFGVIVVVVITRRCI